MINQENENSINKNMEEKKENSSSLKNLPYKKPKYRVKYIPDENRNLFVSADIEMAEQLIIKNPLNEENQFLNPPGQVENSNYQETEKNKFSEIKDNSDEHINDKDNLKMEWTKTSENDNLPEQKEKNILSKNQGFSKKKGGRISYLEMEESVQKIHLPAEDYLKGKAYHPIIEVAEWFQVNPSLLRYWEKEFNVLQPRKNKKGDRFYNYDDIKLIENIFHLLRVKKYSIKGAKEYLKEFILLKKERENLIITLVNLKESLQKMQHNL